MSVFLTFLVFLPIQVQELIDYIEKQRNTYRNNVERLMIRLDPGKDSTNPVTSPCFPKY